MKTGERIDALHHLGLYLKAIDVSELDSLIEKARAQNSWFTVASVRLGLEGVIRFLDEKDLKKWCSTVHSPQSTVEEALGTGDWELGNADQHVAIGTERGVLENTGVRKVNGQGTTGDADAYAGKKVGIVMAGNIPFVGFHDLLAVLITGNVALVKLSSKDAVLIRYLVEKLIEIEPRFEGRVEFVEQLKGFDAVIATGSDNSARYFEYYFGKYPHVIRKNRTSCAILRGTESREEFIKLGHDVFSYFGLGCRNVSKLYVPAGYDFIPMLNSWEVFVDIIHHHKYHNNYDYQKSILLVNLIHFLDNGFVMITESERLVSPISVVYFEQYANEADLREKLKINDDKIQCIVGDAEPATVRFGEAQQPALWDYADRVDTLKFLTALQ